MNLRIYILFIFLCFIIFACINNKTPVYEDTPEIIRPDSEKTTITVYGYGYCRGKSKTAVQRFAIQGAKVSIAEQVKGSAFSLRVKNSTIVFSADTGEVELGGIRTVEEKIWQKNDEWEMYIIQRAEVDVATPRGTEIIVQDIIGEDEDVTFLLSTLKEQAVKDAVIKDEELARKDEITGRIYLTSLEIEPLPDREGISARVRFHIIFD